MKKALFVFLIGLLATPVFGKVGIQLGGGASNLGFIYYTDDYQYGAGFNIGHLSDNNTAKTSATKLGLFARYNQNVAPQTYIGLGVSSYFMFGKQAGSDIDSYMTFSPYLLLDYHLSEHLILSAGTNLVIIKQEQLSGQSKVTSYQFLPAFMSLTYML